MRQESALRNYAARTSLPRWRASGFVADDAEKMGQVGTGRGRNAFDDRANEPTWPCSEPQRSIAGVRGCLAGRLSGASKMCGDDCRCEPCKAWALWDCPEQLCSGQFHTTRGPELTPEERLTREKQRTRPTCDCAAYPFPHRPGNGLCRWSEDPIESILPAGKRKTGRRGRRAVTAIRRRFNI